MCYSFFVKKNTHTHTHKNNRYVMGMERVQGYAENGCNKRPPVLPTNTAAFKEPKALEWDFSGEELQVLQCIYVSE